jgi:hypothetical protein
MNKKTPIALGVLLLAGALFGSFSTLKNVVNYIPDGNWSFGGTQLLFLLVFVYIATVGFKLIKSDSNVANQAKWIFLLQAPIISIQGLFHWSWSTGLQGLVGYSSKYGVLTHFPIPLYQAGANFHLQPADTIVGINLVALGLAWVAHKISKQAAHMPTDTLLNNVQPQVKNLGNAAQISAGLNNHALGALLQKWAIVSNLIKLVLGALLIYGSIAGAVGTLEYIDGYFSDNDYLKGSIYVLYLLTFIYIGVVGFKLSGHFGRVIKQAKWIFALQVPMLNIPHMINWSWSTGVGANIGFEGGQFLLDMPQLQEADMNFLYPDDEFGLALNLAALLFAYLLHLLGKQSLKGQNSAKQVFPAEATNTQVSEDHYVQAYQELQTKTQDIATWAKALATSNGDNDMAEATYLRTRVEALQQINASNQAPLPHQINTVSQEQSENDWSLKKKLAVGLGAITLAILLIFSGTLERSLDNNPTDYADSNENPMESKHEENEARLDNIEEKKQKIEMLNIIEATMDCRKNYNNGDYSQALASCKMAAEEGSDRESQYALGLMFAKSRGVEKDLKKAAEWIEKAAEQGQANAQNYIGTMYQDGEGVTQDNQKAIEWISKAAEQGEAVAQNNLGVIYSNGELVNKDYNKAAEWIRKSANQGYATAQFELGYMYQEGLGVKQSDVMAFEWYLKAANQGDADAQNEMGIMYFRGRGTEKDENKAVEWLRKAANQGHVSAKESLANIGY